MADYFVDATGGDDSNAGTSAGAAWKTIAKIKDFEANTGFANNDTISFKRGEVFHDLSAGATGIDIAATGITFGAYDTGDDPIIHAAGPDTSGSFSDEGDGTWTFSPSGLSNTNNALFEDTVKLTQVESVGALVAGSYFFDENDSPTPTYHYMPTSGVPTDHVVTRGNNKTSIALSTGCTVQNINFQGGGNAAVNVEDNCTVDSCTISNIKHGIVGATAPTTTISITNNTFDGCIRAIFNSSSVVGNFHTDWTISGNSVESVDQDDLNLMYFKNNGTWIDREGFLSGQRMHGLRCFENGTAAQPLIGIETLHPDDTSGVAIQIIALWVSADAGQSDDCQIFRNFFGAVKDRAIGLGASSTDGATTDAQIYQNDFDGCPIAIKTNTNNTSNPTLIYENNFRNCGTVLEQAFTKGVDFTNNSVRADDYFVQFAAAYSSGTFDNNSYYGTALWDDGNGDISTFSAWQTAVGEANSFHDEATVTLVLKQDFEQATAGDAALIGNTLSYGANSSDRKYFDSDGVLQSAANDTARLASHLFNGTSWVNKGLLIEGARTNLALQSETFDNAVWGKVRSSISANAIAAPDGNTTADELVEDATAANSHYFRDSLTVVADQLYCQSIFAKANTRTWLLLGRNAGSTPSEGVFFDLANGVVGTVGSGSKGHGMIDCGDGWYRCWVIDSLGATTWNFDVALADADNSGSYDGDGSSSLYLWGAQLEAVEGTGDAPSSYITTTSSSATRNADDVAIALNVNSPLSVVVDGHSSFGQGSSDQVAVALHDGTTDNNVVIARKSGTWHRTVRTAAAEVADLATDTLADETDFEDAYAGDNDDFAASLDGGTVRTDSAGNAPDGITTVEVGQDSANASHFFGHVTRLRVWDERLANATLQSPPSFTAAGGIVTGSLNAARRRRMSA